MRAATVTVMAAIMLLMLRSDVSGMRPDGYEAIRDMLGSAEAQQHRSNMNTRDGNNIRPRPGNDRAPLPPPSQHNSMGNNHLYEPLESVRGNLLPARPNHRETQGAAQGASSQGDLLPPPGLYEPLESVRDSLLPALPDLRASRSATQGASSHDGFLPPRENAYRAPTASDSPSFGVNHRDSANTNHREARSPFVAHHVPSAVPNHYATQQEMQLAQRPSAEAGPSNNGNNPLRSLQESGMDMRRRSRLRRNRLDNDFRSLRNEQNS